MLERLAPTMYRRRRRVLIAWIVALIGTFVLSGVIGGAFHTEFKLPGTESQAAFDLLQQSSQRDRQVQGQIVFKAENGVTDPAVQSAMEGLFDQDPAGHRERHGRQPLLARGRPADRAQRSQRRLRRDQLRRPLQRGVPGRRQEDQGARRPDRRARSGDRLRRRHVRHEPAERRHRGHRSPRGDDHPADRLRLGDRDGAADRHRAVRHRHRYRDRAESAHHPRHARLHHRGRRDGRPRRRDRLRAVHRHALPREPRTPVSTPNAASCTRSTPPAARCSSPGPP